MPLGVLPELSTDIVHLVAWAENLKLQGPLNEGDSDDEEAFSQAFSIDK
jgi:hypothetical protein